MTLAYTIGGINPDKKRMGLNLCLEAPLKTIKFKKYFEVEKYFISDPKIMTLLSTVIELTPQFDCYSRYQVSCISPCHQGLLNFIEVIQPKLQL